MSPGSGSCNSQVICIGRSDRCSTFHTRPVQKWGRARPLTSVRLEWEGRGHRRRGKPGEHLLARVGGVDLERDRLQQPEREVKVTHLIEELQQPEREVKVTHLIEERQQLEQLGVHRVVRPEVSSGFVEGGELALVGARGSWSVALRAFTGLFRPTARRSSSSATQWHRPVVC